LILTLIAKGREFFDKLILKRKLEIKKMKEFKDIYEEYFGLIQNKLFEIAENTKPNSMKEPFVYLIENGGKRLRPILTMLSAGAVNGNPLLAINSGVSLEIMHNFTLVHDDIMDSSPLRRGKKTVHTKWDESTAILLGDIMVGIALQLLITDVNHNNFAKMQSVFNDSLVIVCEGQALDVEYNEKQDIHADDYLDMISKKTGNLIKAAVLMGCYAGNANENQIELMTEFAICVGLAFQIQDDYLDLTSNDTGKIIGQDIVEGKKTFMIIRSKALAKDKKDIDLMADYYANNGLERERIPEMLSLIERLGIFTEAKEMFENYYQKAFDSIDKLEQNEYTMMLKELVELTKNRKF